MNIIENKITSRKIQLRSLHYAHLQFHCSEWDFYNVISPIAVGELLYHSYNINHWDSNQIKCVELMKTAFWTRTATHLCLVMLMDGRTDKRFPLLCDFR